MTRGYGIMNHIRSIHHTFQQALADIVWAIVSTDTGKATTYSMGVEERGVISLNQVLKFTKE